jgi:hypothetical protein
MDFSKFQYILVIFLYTAISYSQTITISGIVTDAADNSPLVGVNVYTKVPLLGASTNSNGRFTFNLPQRYRGTTLYFSTIGYKTDSMRITQSNNNILIKLDADAYALSDLVVMHDDALRRLLREAFERIPENYPSEATRYEVFYREADTDINGDIISVAEAVLEVYKDKYDRPRPGQVSVQRSRKNILSQYDSIVGNIRFHGGPHYFVERDMVYQRADFINPYNYNRYEYKLVDMTRLDGQDIYVIEFKSKTSSLNGRLYIDVNSLAYVKIVRNLPEERKEFRMIRSQSVRELNYLYVNDKWHLNNLTIKQIKEILPSNKIINTSLEYVTLNINTENVTTIPYSERLDYFEPFLEYAQQYDPEFWTGYNILEPSGQLQLSLLANNDVENMLTTKRNVEKRATWVDILLNIYVEYGLTYSQLSSTTGNYSFEGPSNIKFEKEIAKQETNFEFTTVIGYKLSKHAGLYFRSTAGISNTSDLYSSRASLGYEYRVNIKQRGHPLFVGGGLELQYSQFYLDWGNFQDYNYKFKLKNKTFNTNKLNIWSGLNQYSISPSLSFSKRISKFFELKFYGKYDYVFTSNEFVRIREREGFFLTRKSATISADSLAVTDNDGTELKNYLNIAPFQVGVVLRCR